MIKYSIKCENGHLEESWFRSSEDFNQLNSKKLINCSICGNSNIEKSIMAPSIASKSNKKAVTPPKPNIETQIKTMKSELRDAKNVGWKFSEVAREMHSGKREPEQIYGKTKLDDAVELLKDGINIMPLPFDPDDKIN